MTLDILTYKKRGYMYAMLMLLIIGSAITLWFAINANHNSEGFVMILSSIFLITTVSPMGLLSVVVLPHCQFPLDFAESTIGKFNQRLFAKALTYADGIVLIKTLKIKKLETALITKITLVEQQVGIRYFTKLTLYTDRQQIELSYRNLYLSITKGKTLSELKGLLQHIIIENPHISYQQNTIH